MTNFKVGDIVTFENLRETFFLAKGQHIGDVVSADHQMVVVNVQGKQGTYQCPVPEPRVSYAFPSLRSLSLESRPRTGTSGQVWAIPEHENQQSERAEAYAKSRELHPELNVRESITLTEYLLTGRTG